MWSYLQIFLVINLIEKTKTYQNEDSSQNAEPEKNLLEHTDLLSGLISIFGSEQD